MDNSKQPNRPHYIREWAAHRGFESQADLAAQIGADKSTVSRWWSGASPTLHWQEVLAELFACERESLFRHPDDDWMSRFLQNRPKDEVDRIKIMLEAAFPMQKAG